MPERAPHADRGHRRTLSALLVSYLPMTLHSLGVAAAFLGGWELDVWVVSSSTATADDISATIREALAIVLEPFSAGRHIATAASAVLLAVLLRRTCAIPLRA